MYLRCKGVKTAREREDTYAGEAAPAFLNGWRYKALFKVRWGIRHAAVRVKQFGT